MNRYFIDSAHFTALANPNDQLHKSAVRLANELSGVQFVTTEAVLTEFLNFYSESGEFMRRKVADMVRSNLLDPKVEVLAGQETTFLEALELYESRPYKGYSLTDCISMNVCRDRNIKEVLSSDKHFQQEGFVCLL